MTPHQVDRRNLRFLEKLQPLQVLLEALQLGRPGLSPHAADGDVRPERASFGLEAQLRHLPFHRIGKQLQRRGRLTSYPEYSRSFRRRESAKLPYGNGECLGVADGVPETILYGTDTVFIHLAEELHGQVDVVGGHPFHRITSVAKRRRLVPQAQAHGIGEVDGDEEPHGVN